MTENRRDRVSPPAVGAVSLLVSFAVLCLTVFALLSLTTVRADQRLEETSAQAVRDYYAADLEAQAILSRLRSGVQSEQVTIQSDSSGTYASYACPISDTQELQVELELGEEGAYRVLRWQVVPVGEWELDETLDLWDGELF